MARSFRDSRKPKKYVWVFSNTSSQFNDGNVSSIQLVLGADFTTQGGIGAQQHVLNIKRIVGDLYIQAADAAVLDNIADGFIFGHAVWGIYIQDVDAPVVDPQSAAAADETSLGTGLTEGIGLGIDTSTFVSGTGLGVAFAHQYPFSTVVHFDIHSNRRLENDQQLVLNVTRPALAAFNLQGEEDYFMTTQLRTLVQLP